MARKKPKAVLRARVLVYNLERRARCLGEADLTSSFTYLYTQFPCGSSAEHRMFQELKLFDDVQDLFEPALPRYNYLRFTFDLQTRNSIIGEGSKAEGYKSTALFLLGGETLHPPTFTRLLLQRNEQHTAISSLLVQPATLHTVTSCSLRLLLLSFFRRTIEMPGPLATNAAIVAFRPTPHIMSQTQHIACARWHTTRSSLGELKLAADRWAAFQADNPYPIGMFYSTNYRKASNHSCSCLVPSEDQSIQSIFPTFSNYANPSLGDPKHDGPNKP